ncbi:hypothetical protein N181_01820 [Sinorhizobium fredii USDA 205]|uniref:methyl-accepting chemotaxis protein n=1 Tax=Rhizobium fredii TaxID=380 RepID=UPI0007297180|nr:methyl-accepting chemotaxis protein [Sinorhizobium fredii]KSV87363.1 hypothetical protein N181_01820 [Sinorhizobium fredii USDA 205]GLS09015.1 hypothetical protein GCM10007864_26450 [Sinorhizobium fredii]
MKARFDIRQFVRVHGPTIVFIVMTVCGCLTIWFGKLHGLDLATVTMIPLGMMCLYFIISFAAAGLRLHNEQAGDNLYYMGFLFTLTSLGVSLYQFNGGSTDEIVRNFGIAIISTMGGIGLRILFNQMRRDPADIERAVRHELAEMTRRVRTELDSSAMEFSDYRRTSNQMLSEGFEEIARQAERNGEAVRAAIEAMSLQATLTIQAASERLASILEASHQHIEEISRRNAQTVAEMSEKLNASVGQVGDRADRLALAMDGVIEKYASARSPDEVLKIDVNPVVAALQTLIEDQGKAINENAAGTRETAKRVLAAISPFKQTNASIAALASRLDEANSTANKSAEALGEMLKRLEQVAAATVDSTESTAALTKRIDETLAATKEATDVHSKNSDRIGQLMDAVKASTDGSKLVADKLSAVSDGYSKRIDDLTASLEKSATAADKTAQVMDLVAGRLSNQPPEIRINGHQQSENTPGTPEASTLANVAHPVVNGDGEDKPKKAWWSR